MKRQWTKEGKSIRGIAASMMLAATMCLSLAACGSGDPTDIETSTDSLETVTDETEEPTTAAPIQETEETTEDNAERIDISSWGEPSIEISGDWDQDRDWDRLAVYSEEMEGSIYMLGLQLNISGRKSYLYQSPWAISYEDFLYGDFDGDNELEYAIIFDIHAQGANGGYGMMILDYVDGQWVDVTQQELFVFTGFSYDVVSDGAAGGYRIIGKDSGKEHFVEADEVLEEDGGMVTPFWLWAVVEGEDHDSLEIWQYAAGGHKINQIGDVVVTFYLQDGKLVIQDERVSQELIEYDTTLADAFAWKFEDGQLDGEYYIHLVNHAGMVIECAPENRSYELLKEYGAFWVPFHSGQKEFFSAKIEPTLEINVTCSQQEFLQGWDKEKLHYIEFTESDDLLAVYSVKEILQEESISGRWSGLLYEVKRAGDQLEILPLEYVAEDDAQRLQELSDEGWNVEKLPFNEMYHHYVVRYEEEIQMVNLQETTRYYAIDSFGIVRISQEEMYLKEDQLSGDYRIVIKDGNVECILEHWLP